MNAPWEILEGDVTARLSGLEAGSFHCCVVSPPYWSLRDYGTGTWEGGDAACDHKGPPVHGSIPTSTLGPKKDGLGPNNSVWKGNEPQFRDLCGKCGARRVDLQLGLERSPDCFSWARQVPRCGACYVCRMTDVFAAVRRVLRDDGTLWVNVAGSYCNNPGNGRGERWTTGGTPHREGRDTSKMGAGWKPKDYVNVPALLAESLRADGWYLRAEIALTKVAPMPESCRDRPTRATEKLYLFSQRPRYFYDGEADRGPVNDSGVPRRFAAEGNGDRKDTGNVYDPASANPAGRNLWDWMDDTDDDLPPAVWEWRPEASKVKHYATFPLWLPLRCIRLGTSAKGVCASCGAPWKRVVREREEYTAWKAREASQGGWTKRSGDLDQGRGTVGNGTNSAKVPAKYDALGWHPSCACGFDSVPARVLDPFCGTATTGVAARLLGRHFTGIELSGEYARISRERLAGCNPLDDAAWAKAVEASGQGELFG